MDSESRVVVLIDMDCFYCQVEEKLNPELAGKPIAVVQYNPWKGGGIIAVNYVARAMGVTRHMRGDEAKEKCPEIQLPSVPCSRGKADITKYRDAGKEVAKVLQRFTPLLERASIDEAYLDVTLPVEERLKTINVNSVTSTHVPNTHALGYDSVNEFIQDVHSCSSDSIDFDYDHAKRLLVGALIVSEIRAAVFTETGYTCSAGIAQNKILAKLVCGMNKPNKQTILPKHSINILYSTLPLKKVKHLGGKFGDTVCEVLRISKMGELQIFTEKELQNKFDEKNGTWLYNIARGIDLEPVQARFNPKSIGCCKQFKGKAALLDLDSLRKWLKDLGDEIEDRLEKDALENNRIPKQMVVSYSTQMSDGRDASSSRSYNFIADDELCGELFSSKALELLMESSEGFKIKEGESNRKLKAPIKFLGISVGKFEDQSEIKKTKRINDYFTAGSSKEPIQDTKPTQQTIVNKTSTVCGKEYILHKFFQVPEKNKENVIVETNSNIETTLDKQESFFAKLLNKKIENGGSMDSVDTSNVASNKVPSKPLTPVCEINCGDNSNDTDCSGSTINNEINTSIALFEEDPTVVDRAQNIRQLLNTNVKENVSDKSENYELLENNDVKNIQCGKNYEKSIKCSECGKSIPKDLVAEHADYHFALKIRDEERELTRKEIREKKLTAEEDKRKQKPIELNKGDNLGISKFLVKIETGQNVETCSECNKKVPVDKFTEHLDFHEAQKLNRELNKKPIYHTTSTKRKRSSSSPVKKQKMPKCRSIDSFFKI